MAAAPATAAVPARHVAAAQVAAATVPAAAVGNGVRFVGDSVRFVSGPGAAAAAPFRHTVASPDVIGLSTLAGAAIGGVIGFGVGIVVAPLVGAVAVGVAAVGTALCATATAPTGIGIPICLIGVPLLGAIGAPLATIASPIVGAVIGAGIGAVVGAGIGASYASAPARIDADAPAKGSASPVGELVAALPAPAVPVVKAAYEDPTVKNIGRALDRAAETNPGIGQALDFAKSVLPAK